MALTSTDYADLLRHLAFNRKGVVISNTQVNKLLFMCYGTYLVLAGNGQRLFEEHPKAWPFGPVFPKVYKTFNRKEMPISIPVEKVREFNSNALGVRICNAVIDKHSHTSAYDLSLWSHEEGSPWYQTVYYGKDGKPVDEIEWNKEIEDETIKKYFETHPVAY